LKEEKVFKYTIENKENYFVTGKLKENEKNRHPWLGRHSSLNG
jgi:hypothetical protein